MRLRKIWETDMAVLEADTDTRYVLRHPFRYTVNLIQTGSRLGQCASDLVYQHGTGKTTMDYRREVGLVQHETEYGVERRRVMYKRNTHRRPTILPWVLPTATSSPTAKNLTWSAFEGC